MGDVDEVDVRGAGAGSGAEEVGEDSGRGEVGHRGLIIERRGLIEKAERRLLI
jgi:hypothetical protein